MSCNRFWGFWHIWQLISWALIQHHAFQLQSCGLLLHKAINRYLPILSGFDSRLLPWIHLNDRHWVLSCQTGFGIWWTHYIRRWSLLGLRRLKLLLRCYSWWHTLFGVFGKELRFWDDFFDFLHFIETATSLNHLSTLLYEIIVEVRDIFLTRWCCCAIDWVRLLSLRT